MACYSHSLHAICDHFIAWSEGMPVYVTSCDSKQDLYKEMMALALLSSTGLLFK